MAGRGGEGGGAGKGGEKARLLKALRQHVPEPQGLVCACAFTGAPLRGRKRHTLKCAAAGSVTTAAWVVPQSNTNSKAALGEERKPN